ncbi:membrane protein, putative [Roseibacterium elongatum DSM 19469]|uniref:Membrane protein, putative n=1 Tax=Roseicyclus elongatus DSM 19469 TaxID=1294273 RepID=W8S981_9RHOB|nr:DMT family transporter [Roseibacterium elongatum]AHM05531.1 membrane protein, putative [Roseibacterium elongatum DSM 19469]
MRGLTPVAQGIVMMIGAIFLFSSMDAMAKALGADYDPVQVVWARYAGQMAVVALLLAPRLHILMRTRHLGLQLLRSGFLFAATLCFFTSLGHLEIASATGVLNIHPVLLTLGAALILKETLGPRRVIGIGAALVGALLIIRPGSDVFSLASLLPLVAGLCYASYALTTRFLGRDEPILTSFLYTALIGTIVASLMVPAVWQTPPPWDAARFVLLGAVGAAGQLLLIRSLTLAEAGVVAPFGYAGVIFATIYGVLFFGETPDPLSALGALVIVGAGVYVWHRETRARRAEA